MVLDFVSGRFDLAELDADNASIAVLEPSSRIVWVNRAWDRFARENADASVAERWGAGSRYLDGISGTMSGYYRRVLDRALATDQPFEQEYECSSVKLFRIFHMRVLPVSGKVLLVEHTPVAVEPMARGADAPDEAAFRDRFGLLRQCGNCRRVRRRDDGWRWVPAWVDRVPPHASHVICAPCAGYYYGPTSEEPAGGEDAAASSDAPPEVRP